MSIRPLGCLIGIGGRHREDPCAALSAATALPLDGPSVFGAIPAVKTSMGTLCEQVPR